MSSRAYGEGVGMTSRAWTAQAWSRPIVQVGGLRAVPLLHGVAWTVPFVAFLAYIVAITTYRLPIGNVAMIAGLVGLAIQRQPRRVPVLLAWFAALILWCAVGYVTTAYPEQTWTGLVDLAKLWAVVLVGANALRTRAQARLYMVAFLGCFALYPLRGAMFNYFFYHSTVFGRAIWNYVYSNPNDLAALALLQLSMAAALFATEGRGWVRRAAQAGIVLLPLLVLMTQSRGAFIALLVFALACVIGQWQRFRTVLAPHRRRRLVIGAIAVVSAVVFFAPDGVWERVAGLRHLTTPSQLDEVDQEGSARQRFEIWRVAAKIIREHPLTGIGIGAYPLAHQRYARGEEFEPTAAGRRDTHSTILNLLAEAGVTGLLAFLGLVLTTVVGADRARRGCRHHAPDLSLQLFYLEMGLLAFFTAGIFGSFEHLSFLYLHLLLLWVLATLAREAQQATRLVPQHASWIPTAHRPHRRRRGTSWPQ